MLKVKRSLGKIGELQEIRVDSESGYSRLEWRVPYILSLFAEDNEFYRSDSFHSAGECWHLRVYPKEMHISAYLVKEESSSECRVMYSVRLMGSDATLPSEFAGGYNEMFGACEEEHMGFSYNRSDLELCSSELSGVVTILCFLQRAVPLPASHVGELPASPKALEETSDFVEASAHKQSKFYCEKLSHDFSELMVSGDCCDFTIQVKDKEFRVHRAILSARSPVFQSMFKQDTTAEAQTGGVTLNDCDPDAFRAFVRYVYTGKTDHLHADTIFGTCSLADKYQTEELKSSCLAFIGSTLSVETFCDVVRFALKYDDRGLLDLVTDFLSDKISEVTRTVEWANFLAANPVQGNELLQKALDRKQH